MASGLHTVSDINPALRTLRTLDYGELRYYSLLWIMQIYIINLRVYKVGVCVWGIDVRFWG